jgi:hypothetical protein
LVLLACLSLVGQATLNLHFSNPDARSLTNI